MVELKIKDAAVAAANAAAGVSGGCGCGSCGCGADAEAQPTEQVSAGATIAEYTVTGMTCGHCVSAVTEEVSAIPGVTDVHVDLDSGALKVTSDAPVDFDRMVEAVAEAGDYSIA